MPETARGLALATESPQPLGVSAHLRGQDLYGDAIAKQNVPRRVDGAHAAFAEHGLNLILAIENCAYDGSKIIFQNFAIRRAEADVGVEFSITNWAVLHGK
jgi:hypothetical protein